ncbi:type 1 fimbrial protein [Salmonella enterica]
MKIKTIGVVVALMFTGAANAASGDVVGTQDVTINGSIVNSTCSVSFPNDYTFAPINLSDWKAAQIQDAVSSQEIGNITLSACPASTDFNYKLTTPHVTKDNISQANAVTADTGDVIEAIGLRMMLGENNIDKVAKLDGSVQGLGASDANGNLTVPVYAAVVKRGEPVAQDGSDWTGNFKGVFTYTVTYK